MDREFLESLGVAQETAEVILAEHGRQVQDWQDKYTQAVADAENARFGGMLDSAISAARGRNAKAITALLDMDAIRASEDPKACAEAALAELKKHNAYLFEAPVPSPYAPGTGTGDFSRPAPQTLAGALKEKFKI